MEGNEKFLVIKFLFYLFENSVCHAFILENKIQPEKRITIINIIFNVLRVGLILQNAI
jgi:hypothetical protein